MIRLWKPSTTTLKNSLGRMIANPWLRMAFMTLFYLGILTGLILLYGKGDFSTPSFIYQGF
ncbi:MAG: teichoic acid D-Ala incorporation-associated protein DltX [Chloroflexi bacterium]|nr:teichoic acid D-Ala incorporation-associated protein DltX [Chloroflexota bacterium]